MVKILGGWGGLGGIKCHFKFFTFGVGRVGGYLIFCVFFCVCVGKVFLWC